MNYISLNKKDRTPMSAQVYQSIYNAIERGELRNNDPLPFEEDIAQFYGINRRIVRLAYEQLQQEGLIVRIRRKGTFVTSKPVVVYELKDLLSLKKLFEKHQASYHHRILLIEDIVLNHPKFPQIFKSNFKKITHVSLLVYIENSPFAIQDLYIPFQIENIMLQTYLRSDNPIEDMLKHRNLQLKSITDHVQAITLSNITMKSLALSHEDTLNFHELHYQNKQDQTFLVNTLAINGSKNYLHIEVKGL